VRKVFTKAEVYGPSGGNTYYSVVIGSQLTVGDAQATVKRALLYDLPDAYVWRLGDPGVLASGKSYGDMLGYTAEPAVRIAAGIALVKCGKGCLDLVRDILTDTATNLVRDRNLLLEELDNSVYRKCCSLRDL
jgi:hypothetical protein